jgi:D-aminoacyl-tRNA deacylase
MRVVVQRVLQAGVDVMNRKVARIGRGLVLFVAFEPSDNESDYQYISEKVSCLRIFEDDQGKMNISLKDIRGQILLIPNFTLYGDARKGRRPSFSSSSDPSTATIQFEQFKQTLKQCGCEVFCGVFRVSMKVSLINDGPVTILLDSKKNF